MGRTHPEYATGRCRSSSFFSRQPTLALGECLRASTQGGKHGDDLIRVISNQMPLNL